MKNSLVTIQEESYTSKCDALYEEEVCKHKTYAGRRIKRGLFKSKTGKLINADVNGAINIMRKYCKTKKIKFAITGENILNPKKLTMSN